MRLGGVGPDDLTRALSCEVVFGGSVLWGLTELPHPCLYFLISLRVRLWVGLYVRVRLCGRGDGCDGDAVVGVSRCARITSTSGRPDGAWVWGFNVFSFTPCVMSLPGLVAAVRLCVKGCHHDIVVTHFTQVDIGQAEHLKCAR